MNIKNIYTRQKQVRREQLHKRMGWENITQIVQGFVDRTVSARVACQWLGIARSRLYELRQKWQGSSAEERSKKGWITLHSKRSSRLDSEVQSFLEKELIYLKKQSPFFKEHFN